MRVRDGKEEHPVHVTCKLCIKDGQYQSGRTTEAMLTICLMFYLCSNIFWVIFLVKVVVFIRITNQSENKWISGQDCLLSDSDSI